MTRRLSIHIYVDDPRDPRAIPDTREGAEYCHLIQRELVEPFVRQAFLNPGNFPKVGSSIGYSVNLGYPPDMEDFYDPESL